MSFMENIIICSLFLSAFLVIIKKHRPSDIYYIRKAAPTIANPCKSRALSTVCEDTVYTVSSFFGVPGSQPPCLHVRVLSWQRASGDYFSRDSMQGRVWRRY